MATAMLEILDGFSFGMSLNVQTVIVRVLPSDFIF